jgi:hypothetical protein
MFPLPSAIRRFFRVMPAYATGERLRRESRFRRGIIGERYLRPSAFSHQRDDPVHKNHAAVLRKKKQYSASLLYNIFYLLYQNRGEANSWANDETAKAER